MSRNLARRMDCVRREAGASAEGGASMDSCPECKSRRVHRSRTRGRLERLRCSLTGKAPFRCSDCGWRGWAFDFGMPGEAVGTREPDGAEPDLRAIDREMTGTKDGAKGAKT